MKRKPIYKIEELEGITSSFDIKHLLKEHAYQNKPTNFEEGYLLGIYALFPLRSWLSNLFQKGRGNSLTDRMESAARRSLATICALHNKATYAEPGAAEQVAGICAAIFDYDIALSKNGFLTPKVEFAIDNCGMGGDVLVTPNVSTVAALIAAASGIPMCKHGSPANADAGRHGSSEFMAIALGIAGFEKLIGIPKEKVEKCIEKFNYGYTEACDTGYKAIHIQTHRYADLPHMNDLIGPITNPLYPRLATKKIIGINHLIEPRVVAEAHKILNEKGVTHLQEGLFIRGYVHQDRKGPENNDGVDEASIMPGGTHVARLKNGKIDEFNLYAEDFGLVPVEYSSICPDKRGKGQFSYDILVGAQRGEARSLILANAALIENLARGTNLKEAYKKMEAVLESGAPFENLRKVKECLFNQ